jgi:hypothetical protein
LAYSAFLRPKNYSGIVLANSKMKFEIYMAVTLTVIAEINVNEELDCTIRTFVEGGSKELSDQNPIRRPIHFR